MIRIAPLLALSLASLSCQGGVPDEKEPRLEDKRDAGIPAVAVVTDEKAARPYERGKGEFLCPKGDHFRLVIGLQPESAIRAGISGSVRIHQDARKIWSARLEHTKEPNGNWLKRHGQSTSIVAWPSKLDAYLTPGQLYRVDADVESTDDARATLWLAWLDGKLPRQVRIADL